MKKRVYNPAGHNSLKVLVFALLIIFSTGCGEFVRDTGNTSKSYKDSGLNSDSGIDITDTNEEVMDTDTADAQSNEIPISTDVSIDEYNSDTDMSDNYYPTDVSSIDFDYHQDVSSEDINPDTFYSDITSSDDISNTCDCDTNWCGLCYYPGTEGLKNEELKNRLYVLIKDHQSLGYDSARYKMFSEIDNKDGYVECVYTGFKLKTSGIPDSSIMNTEHTWPQSEGAGNEPARSDLFHLFPTKSEANSRRGSYPFGTVIIENWSEGGSKLGTDNTGKTVFEPRDVHKGNVARAMFYFSVRYRLPIDNKQEAELRNWHILDPVDKNEIERCNKINSYQKNRNPFVDWPDFVNRIEDF